MVTQPLTSPPTSDAGHGPEEIGRLRVVTLELTEPFPAVALDGHQGLRVIALHRGAPVGEVDVAGGAGATAVAAGPLADAVRAGLWREAWRARLADTLRARLGAAGPEDFPRRPVTVVVCTRDGVGRIERCLAAIAALDPAPDEVLVVDNASRESCAEAVRAHGFRHVAEPIPGLDNARNRALAEVRTEVVAFTDDDCLPARGWLAPMRRHLASEAVAAVTGIGCPFELTSEAQVAFEEAAGFSLGYRVKGFDTANLRPTDAGVVGAGANLVALTERLREAGGFPPELDVGTPTRSGGDTYVMSRLMGAGWRIVYDPAQMVWHDHRASEDAVRRTLEGYGVGVAAMGTRALVVDHVPEALSTITWPVRNLARTAARAARLRTPLADVSAAMDLARGSLKGPGAWAAARRLPGRPLEPRPAPAADRPRVPGGAAGPAVDLTVVVPTIARRRAALARCLDAIGAQTLDRSRYEVVVVPNGPGSSAVGEIAGADAVVPLAEASKGGARNAGAEAARAETIVFVDDDVLLDPGCLEAHLGAAGERGVVSLGPYVPAPPGRDPLDQFVSRWWHDTFARLRRPDHRFTFVDLLTGNLALPRELLRATGGFDPAFPDREDWDLGWRLLDAGARFATTPAASAVHEHAITPAKSLTDNVRRGIGDVMLVERHPEALTSLPLARAWEWYGSRRWRAALAIAEAAEDPRRRAAVMAPLGALRRAGGWRRWLRVFARIQQASYCLGVQRAIDAGLPAPGRALRRTRVDLAGSGPVEPGVAAGEVEIALGERVLGTVTLPGGQWDAEGLVAAAVEDLDLIALAAYEEASR
jgi:glycosyltransferase involved in cell wall biosynthesis